MTIFWLDLLPKVQALITRLAVEGTDPLWLAQGAEWSHQSHSYVAPDTAVQIDLKITNSSDGEWETRYVPYVDPDTGLRSNRAVFTGQREFVLNVQCKAYQADMARWALVYGERIRSGLQRNAVLDEIGTYGMVFWDYGPLHILDGKEDGEAVQIANVDFFGRAGFSDDPATAVLVPLFASISVTSKLTGYTPGAPPNFSDTFTPPPAA